MNERLTHVANSAAKNRNQFERFCRSLSPEELASPIPGSHWRVTDYISHLASIDIWVGEWFGAMADGRHFIPRADDGGPFDIDRWNDARIDERRDSTVDDLFAEAARARDRLLATFPRFSEETLASRFNFRGKGISFIEYLEAWTLHDPAHAMDMLKALPGRKQEPAVRAWIDAFRAEAMREVADVDANKAVALPRRPPSPGSKATPPSRRRPSRSALHSPLFTSIG